VSPRVLSVRLRDFRSYESAEIWLGDGLTVITGSNGAGKTNLVEALYFGCTGRSCRTSNEREVVRFGAQAARVVLATEGEDGPHELSVGFQPGEPKRMRADGAPVDRLLDVPDRPLVSVFLPDRLELIKGAPALRRGHLDAFIAALWPARVQTRRAYAQALAQRNALLGRLHAGAGRAHSAATLASWDVQLARHGLALMADRAAAVESIAAAFARLCAELGLDGDPGIRYRPRSRAGAPEEFVSELAERVDSDLERGFTGHGPHRDEVSTVRGGRELRAYGSQGQQRLALLAWLLAERSALAERRSAPPVMLLDDVMSELDARRRRALVDLLREGGGQSIITATDGEQVPVSARDDVHRIEVAAGGAIQQTPAGDSARVVA
jgi:DNA replication and repair protein RecF